MKLKHPTCISDEALVHTSALAVVNSYCLIPNSTLTINLKLKTKIQTGTGRQKWRQMKNLHSKLNFHAYKVQHDLVLPTFPFTLCNLCFTYTGLLYSTTPSSFSLVLLYITASQTNYHAGTFMKKQHPFTILQFSGLTGLSWEVLHAPCDVGFCHLGMPVGIQLRLSFGGCISQSSSEKNQ